MLDVISRGRIEMGFVKGVPFEISAANTNPADRQGVSGSARPDPEGNDQP